MVINTQTHTHTPRFWYDLLLKLEQNEKFNCMDSQLHHLAKFIPSNKGCCSNASHKCRTFEHKCMGWSPWEMVGRTGWKYLVGYSLQRSSKSVIFELLYPYCPGVVCPATDENPRWMFVCYNLHVVDRTNYKLRDRLLGCTQLVSKYIGPSNYCKRQDIRTDGRTDTWNKDNTRRHRWRPRVKLITTMFKILVTWPIPHCFR